jgi:hypothetical protein
MEHAAYPLEPTCTQSCTKTSRSAGSSKASGITNGTSSLLGGGSMRNRSSLSPNRRRTRKQDPHLLFSFSSKELHPKPREPKSDEEKRRIARWRVVQECEREASCLYHQFVYQISKERERIQDESTSREGAGVSIADINTRAYQNVKNTWTKRGIWNRR